MRRTSWVIAGAAAAAGVVAATAIAAGPARDATSITIFEAPDAAPLGAADQPQADVAPADTAAGTPAPTGAIVTERRELPVDGDELRLGNVPATLDPASVQVRGLDGALAVTEQRFVPGATTVAELLAHHIGEPVTVTTPAGDVTGTLRAADDDAIVVETSGALRVLRRDGFVQDVKLPRSGPAGAQLVWRLADPHPGKAAVEVTYRTEGLAWTADYSAIYDRAAKTVDFAAWATVRNHTTASFDNAALALVTAGGGSAASRFAVPGLVRLGAGETVQVELMPPRTGAKARPIVAFEAMPDPAASPPPITDCDSLNEQTAGKAEIALELDTAAQLPAGKIRVFERDGARLDALADDQLLAGPNAVRVPLAPDTEITGERATSGCTYDEQARTLRETVDVTVENHGTQRASAVVREYLWRSAMWKIEPDEKPKGVRAGPQAREYRVDVAPGAKQVITYTVDYSW